MRYSRIINIIFIIYLFQAVLLMVNKEYIKLLDVLIFELACIFITITTFYLFKDNLPIKIIINKNKEIKNYRINYVLLILSTLLLVHAQYTNNFLEYYINGNASILRSEGFESGFSINSRLLGFISILSTMVSLKLFYRYNQKVYVFIIPMIISMMNAVLTAGRGFFIINCAVLLGCIYIKNGFNKVGILIFSVLVAIFFGVYLVRDSGTDANLLIYIFTYITGPLYGMNFLMDSNISISYLCINPLILKVAECNPLTLDITYSIDAYENISNVFGNFGWNYLYSGYFGVIISSAIDGLILAMTSRTLNDEFLGPIGLYIALLFSLFSFFMNVFLFNGFIYIVFLLYMLISIAKFIKKCILRNY